MLQTESTASALPALRHFSKGEWVRTLAIAAAAFLLLGTVTALWRNPFFIRMTPTAGWDWVILALEAGLLGLYLGMQAPACRVGQASLGGVLGFLGFGCVVCNQLLLLIFGAGFLLQWFEPVRYPVGFLGVAVLAWAVWRKLQLRAATAAPGGAGRPA